MPNTASFFQHFQKLQCVRVKEVLEDTYLIEQTMTSQIFMWMQCSQISCRRHNFPPVFVLIKNLLLFILYTVLF